MKFTKFLNQLFLYCSLLFLWACKKGKGAICHDGWESHSTGRGTCSWHGGVDHYIDPNEIAIGRTTFLIIFLVFGLWFLFQIIKNNNSNK